MITSRYGELHGLSTVSVRLSTPYGPMERITGHRAVMSVFYDWTGRAVRGESITPQGLSGGRDYTYISDIANGIRTVLDSTSLLHSLYNITSGTWVTYKQILDAVVELSPATSVEDFPSSPNESSGENYSRGPLSGHRLFEDLGWTPKFDLKAGLLDYIKWRQNYGFLD